MKILTAQQIQKLDRWAIETIGIPSLALMENAGRQVAEVVIKKLKGKKLGFVAVVCGLGNNAGDGFVAARYLANAGVKTVVYVIGMKQKLKNDALINYHAAKNLRIPVVSVNVADHAMLRDLMKADVVLDAIFGIGLDRPIEEPFKSMIESINHLKKYVIAVDVPSGLDATTGKVLGVCVKAKQTVTFTAAKTGLLKASARQLAGKIIVVDIGIPRKNVTPAKAGV